MDLSNTLAQVASLSIDERIALVEAIWDSIAAEADQLEPTENQKQEIQRRLAAHATSPGEVIPWERVRADAIKRTKE